MKKHFLIGLAIGAASYVTGQSPGFTAIDYPGATSTSAWGINDRGDIVGLYSLADKTTHGFLRRGTNLTSIDFPGASSTETYGINTAGDIVGDYTANGKIHGFVLSQGRFTTVDVPGAKVTELAAINANNEIVAEYTSADGSSHAVQISHGVFKNIDVPNVVTTLGNGLNAKGEIVGNTTTGGVTHGFLLSDGQLTPIAVPGADFTGAYGIDDSGNIVGRYRDPAGVTHGYIRSGGAFTPIDIPGATLTSAAAMNSVGDIVGRYTAGGVNHAFLVSSPVLKYKVTDLGTLSGGTFSQATFLADNGLIAGISDVADGTQHSVLWEFGGAFDITSPELAGMNSGIFGINHAGAANGQTETATMDPNGEDFCGYGTRRQCRAFVWQNGNLTILPTLGGNNSTVGNINKRGQIAGLAETGVRDPQCPASQPLAFQAVIWGPKQGQVRELAPLPGDSVGEALSINDSGQAVGLSGSCADTVIPPFAKGRHAVMWDKDGTPVNLGSLGGTVDPNTLGLGSIALWINNQGQAVGASALAGNKANHAFLWAMDKGMRDLGTLPGDVKSAAVGINDRGEIIGDSFGAAGPIEGNPRPFLWRNGVMADLNTLVSGDAPLYLLVASSINAQGEIAGFGVTASGDLHAFLATPVEASASTVSSAKRASQPVLFDRAKPILRQRLGRAGVQ